LTYVGERERERERETDRQTDRDRQTEREKQGFTVPCSVAFNGSEFIENKFVLLTECVVNRKGFDIPYFSIDNAHLMYNAHLKLFRHSF
jgi:hypothetical protein